MAIPTIYHVVIRNPRLIRGERLLPVVDISAIYIWRVSDNGIKTGGWPIDRSYYPSTIQNKLCLGETVKDTVWHQRKTVVSDDCRCHRGDLAGRGNHAAVLVRANIAGGVSGRGSRRAALVGHDVAIGKRNCCNRRTRGLKRDGLGGTAVILQPIGGEQRIDVVSHGIAIGAGAGSTKNAGTVIGDIVAAVGTIGDRT